MGRLALEDEYQRLTALVKDGKGLVEEEGEE
jgi:hypothetical protein